MLETKVISKKQNLKSLKWSKYRNSSGTAGSFLKSFSKIGDTKYYYKLSNYDSFKGVIGFECVNEIIVDRLLTLLGIPHLSYQLILGDIIIDEKEIETYLCVSENFRTPNEDKIALDTYYELEHKTGENRLEFCINHGWEEYIYTMLVVDFLILNRDRHGANIEVLRDKKKKTFRLAPLFDHGISLLFNCHTEKEIADYDVLEDKKINSYIGSQSSKDNLTLIPAEKSPVLNEISLKDKDIIFKDLDHAISKPLIDKTWDMIYKRYKYYEDFRNSRKDK